MSTTALDLLDSQLTSAEFDAYRKRSKFLHDCKTKGFARLKKLGNLAGGIELSKTKSAPQHTPLEFATEAAALVNGGMPITKACEKFGRNSGDLRYYCNKFGIKLDRANRTWDHDAMFPKIRHLISRQGYRMKDAARKLDATPGVLAGILKTHGYEYDAKTIKIRKIKT